jgi:putative transposase
MRHHIRNRIGRSFFFTLVTHERRPFLTTSLGRKCLREAILSVQRIHPFNIPAIVLLPDHLHVILELPRCDGDYSNRWRLIKSKFSRLWQAGGGQTGETNLSRRRKRECAIWQRRFYEHTCRDEDDVERCTAYIHINPVKHGLVERAID